jgi:hypothetical protein
LDAGTITLLTPAVEAKLLDAGQVRYTRPAS